MKLMRLGTRGCKKNFFSTSLVRKMVGWSGSGEILSFTFYRVLKTIKMSCLNELSFYCVKWKGRKRRERLLNEGTLKSQNHKKGSLVSPEKKWSDNVATI